MKISIKRALLAVLVSLAVPMLILAADDADSTAIGTLTVEGLVSDLVCPLQNQKSTSTSYNKECIATCLKSGSPLGILTREGNVYVPVTSSMPDTGQNALKPFVGEHVRATGKVFLRNSTHPSKSARYISCQVTFKTKQDWGMGSCLDTDRPQALRLAERPRRAGFHLASSTSLSLPVFTS